MHMLQPIIAKYSSASNIDPESNTDTACNQLVADEGDASADGTSDYQHILAASVDDPAQQSNLTPGSDLLIFASLWQSVISCPHEMCSDSTHKKDSFVCPKVAQEVILTNKNSLFEFKTQIYCYGNSIYEDAAKTIVDPESSLVPLNLPKDPNDTSGVKFTKLPSFFFIEDTFFIDYTCNDSSCSDPVSSIIAWLKNRQKMSDSKFYIPPGSPPQNLTVKDMSSICFENISFQLDKLYLFFHNGNCEHLFTFNELRLVHQYHLSKTRSYPYSLFYQKIKRRKCRLCEVYFAKYITFNDLLAPEVPCFWCERCYLDFHIDPTTKQEYYTDFKLYRYIQE
ncbi:hypothetical protein DI09_208p40 [Mitosporidium daphniae]|uniref:snRNA-activating protein complex subunit 3 n=1 Tax=Mitosporidium daphniae TaxID=1485682 RepID=A0A098VWI7_9MICR|nr:uncharacterized protein DI09_208p40 [Mitosporidium daphniae]KGG52121.1 hypothetical protein DI09_208p40 [Mitosporidium daphniae]|eukprot:XP_013238557.1 uncharacterized protein DI09_208p40 [Mitosporidium daphniae]